MSFLTRWDDDRSAPTFLQALRDVFVRAVLPCIPLFAVIVGFGWLIVSGPLKPLGESENAVNRSLEAARTDTWNTITKYMSMMGNTEYIIAVGILVALIVAWRTKEWWFAVVPLIAISLQATVFVLATAVVGRERPPVEHLDPAPPTSSFPSGHVGASSGLYFSFALMATRIGNPALRRTLVTLAMIVPFLVTFARLYRGMHHVTDVVWGMINGLVCVVLAWLYLRRDPSRSGASSA